MKIHAQPGGVPPRCLFEGSGMLKQKQKGDLDKPMKTRVGKAELMTHTLSVSESTLLIGTTESVKITVNRGKKNETKT